MSSIKKEAERCLKCKKAQCSEHCPVSTPVPQVMELFLNGEIKKAGEIRGSPLAVTVVRVRDCLTQPTSRSCQASLMSEALVAA